MMTDTSYDRVDPRLTLGYGSAWHILRFLGFHRRRFTKVVASEIGAESIEWYDFVPKRSKLVYREHFVGRHADVGHESGTLHFSWAPGLEVRGHDELAHYVMM